MQGSKPRYIWVNIDIDTIRIAQERLLDIVAEWDSIRRLTFECLDFDSFWDSYVGEVWALESTNLNNLTIIDMGGPSGRVHKHSWQEWTLNLVVEFYYKCNPMPFYTRVVAPTDPNGVKFNTENYISLYCSHRKAANLILVTLIMNQSQGMGGSVYFLTGNTPNLAVAAIVRRIHISV